MMIVKKIKKVLILLIMLLIALTPLNIIQAHNVELDPKSLISMPETIINGNATVSISNSVTDYTLYFQAVKVEDSVATQMKQIANDSKLDTLYEEYVTTKNEVDNLNVIYNTQKDKYYNGLSDENLSEEEKQELKTAYETALSNYNKKFNEYNKILSEYKNKLNETVTQIETLTPMYDESKWIQTTDNKVTINTTEFSGEQLYTLWIKLDTGTETYYNEDIYEISGTKINIDVTGVSLNKKNLSLTKNSDYTLIATIIPSDATNKKLIWKSDKEDVATVENGKVTAKSVGTATITVATEDGKFSDTCIVTVTEKTNAIVDDSKNNEITNEITNMKKENDTTVTQGKLPYAGTNKILLGGMTAIIFIAIVFYNKYLKYKDIK